MNIALILTHNKPDNFKQIEDLKVWLELKERVFEEGITYYYTFKNNPNHEIHVYQISPHGVEPPANLYDIDSRKVFYGKGDEDKAADHPRFFNWGLKRAADYGADIAIHLEGKLNLEKLFTDVNKGDFVETEYGKISTAKLLREVGQLDETQTDTSSDFKARIVQKGLNHG